MPAVDRRECPERCGRIVERGGARGAVITPAEGRGRRRQPVDAGQLPDPQVHLNRRRAASQDGPQVTQGRNDQR